MLSYRNNKGITLIALTITIVVMVIIATITINASLNDEGLINEAKNTVENVNDTLNGTTEDMINVYTMITGREED